MDEIVIKLTNEQLKKLVYNILNRCTVEHVTDDCLTKDCDGCWVDFILKYYGEKEGDG